MIHLVKLCVGADGLDDLLAWQARQERDHGHGRHVTRMFPKRRDDLLAGGSLYWVISRKILARQTILDLQETKGADGIKRCAIILDPNVTPTEVYPRNPFQGWRYLKPEDAPPDLRAADVGDAPPELSRELAELGLL